MSNQTIKQHEGSKYLKRISSPVERDENDRPSVIHVDVYAVLEAFAVTCPAIAHCLKKLLMPGQRGKGNIQADLKGAMAALNRAIELQDIREGNPQEHRVKVPQPEPEADPRKEGPEELKARLAEITNKTDDSLEKVKEAAGIEDLVECDHAYYIGDECTACGYNRVHKTEGHTWEAEESPQKSPLISDLRERLHEVVANAMDEDRRILDEPPEDGE